ncbi:MAG: tRNA uridine-5-carboxymethylaminomethyl(34) synthesis GTPase MnmE, partial [Acidobacteria bacterium]|nr:tRNA uridine-5-carboxymethylaminomethyl(34) synthesis GTPase MnmE [Acidobacteriota bacterium]
VVDTAGLREAADAIEVEGVSRSRQAQAVADVVIVVLDRAEPLTEDDLQIVSATSDRVRVIVANKADRAAAWRVEALEHLGCPIVEVSALTGAGVGAMRQHIASALDIELDQDRPEITNVRHAALLQRADAALGRARRAALADGASLSEEFVLADLQDALAALEEISGRRVTDDLLAHIFSRFCIGK